MKTRSHYRAARLCAALFTLLLPAGYAAAEDSVFRIAEPTVQPSPEAAARWNLQPGEEVVDFDVWADRPAVIALVRGADGVQHLRQWRIGADSAETLLTLPAGTVAASVTGHPLGGKLFLGAKVGEESVILSASAAESWQLRRVYASARPLRRLLVSPRPFIASWAPDSGEPQLSYRLVFAERQADGNYSTRSILEKGGKDYQVVGPAASYVEVQDADAPPTRNDAESALPAAFHPAGHILLWQDKGGCFHKIPYAGMNWGASAAVAGKPCGGSLTVTPNGANLLHWKKGEAGVALIGDNGKTRTQLAGEYRFAGTPSSVADGRGVVGQIEEGGAQSLVYVPVRVPLHDVVNAWMYLESPADTQRFSEHQGLFRALRHEQLYQLYDTENYLCGGYDSSTPTRPYFVTTDIFWELIGAAYEGIFIVQEEQQAMPAFWAFTEAAAAELKTAQPDSPWSKVFAAIAPLRDPAASGDAETARIAKAEGSAKSSATGEEFNYGELKPRGHYSGDPRRAAYFKAVHYLTEIAAKRDDTASLAGLSAATQAQARRWIDAYRPFIAPSRAPLVWDGKDKSVPAYARHALARPQVFPLSWGFDNELLLSTVFHPDWPEAAQIRDAQGGGRLLPSGLDLAAALGSGAARGFLDAEFRRYPNLRPAIDAVAQRWPAKAQAGESLYESWLRLLALQWTDSPRTAATASFNPALWDAKRLQTGLASWATLRHATTLVNERISAQCGEGGFEAIVLRPPRGYVEPDAEFFAATARLFEQIEAEVRKLGLADKATVSELGDPTQREGIARRLQATAQQARLFETIARKELRGEALSDAEYEAILLVARVAEHHLLVFKSLSNKDLALSNPDPMMKVADVAGDGPLLLAAVGRPLQWDQIVPFFGRRAIVKGSVYAYHEFSAPGPMNDAQWRAQVDRQARPSWIGGYLSNEELSCPAKEPF